MACSIAARGNSVADTQQYEQAKSVSSKVIVTVPSKRIAGFLCYFVSYDCVEPPHIHLAKGTERRASSAKFWLESLLLAGNRGLNASELRDARRIVEENQDLFLEMWNEHCND